MDWFKLTHGAVTDPKWIVVSRNAETLPGVTWAVWSAMLDHASRNEVRGSVEGFDVESIAAFFGFDQDACERVVKALYARGMVDANHMISKWKTRQGESSSTSRVRAFRERQRNDETVSCVSVTPETVEEKRREVKTPPEKPPQGGGEAFDPLAVELPAWLPVDAWREFVQHRREIREPLTALACTKAIKHLAKFRAAGQDPRAVIDQSIAARWSGVFAVKGAPKVNGHAADSPFAGAK